MLINCLFRSNIINNYKMENRAEFLKQDVITKADIINKVLAPNNFDGLRA